MRNHILLLVFVLGLFSLIGCRGNDTPLLVDNNPPQLQLTASTIHAAQGRTIVLTGIISDGVGIKSINLKNDDWYLDKTIVLTQDSLHKTYQLSYQFLVPLNAPNTPETIQVTVTNVGGKTTSGTINVLEDGDFVPPTINITGSVNDGVTLVPAPSDHFNIQLTVNDDRRLGYLTVKAPSLGLNDSIGNIPGKTYTYTNNSIPIPQVQASYVFTIAVADSAGNIVTKTLNVQVKVSWDFDKMYLSDVSSASLLTSDLFGVPMLVNKTAPFTYQALYFCEAPNTSIKFLAQKTAFGPNCFGVDPNNSGKLTNNVNAAGIVLPSVGYYKITFSTDPSNLSYSVSTFDPMTDPNRPSVFVVNSTVVNQTDGSVAVLGLVGIGFADCPNMNWSPAQIGNYPELQLKQDPTYPYRWTTTVTLQGNVQFIISPQDNWNWWPSPFWRFDTSVDPEMTIMGGGNNLNMTVPTKTTYKFTWDEYLNRAKMVQQ